MLKAVIKNAARKLGYEIVPRDWFEKHPISKDPFPDIDEATRQLFHSVQAITLSGIERVAALRQAVQYIIAHDIPGDIVECGIGKGGSMMAIAKTLLEKNSTDRALYLFDTFAGYPPPTAVDKDLRGGDASQLLQASLKCKETPNGWDFSTLETVQSVMKSSGYDPRKIVYAKGRVEETVPGQAPARIALLRLDTDWYESTYHELTHLFPRLSVGGVLLIDDYGHWQGARRAVDQYLSEKKARVLLSRVDYTARMCVKLDP
jgi:O-methyltransferase